MKDHRNQRERNTRAARQTEKDKRMHHPSGKSRYAKKIKERDPSLANRLYHLV